MTDREYQLFLNGVIYGTGVPKPRPKKPEYHVGTLIGTGAPILCTKEEYSVLREWLSFPFSEEMDTVIKRAWIMDIGLDPDAYTYMYTETPTIEIGEL